MAEFPYTRLSPLGLALALAVVVFFRAPTGGPAQAANPDATVLGGVATVIDGDTLDIDGERIRLEGIDAPEADQTCGGGPSGSWDCGRAATNHLRSLVRGKHVGCETAGRDIYGRVLGSCRASGRNINAEMVRSGHAWAFVRYSLRYQALEAEARGKRIGIWKGEAEPAWVFRADRWQTAKARAPEGCVIKGNISANGRIYHMPWSPWYGEVRIEPDKGERWFCNEAEAAAAGFRPAMGY